MKTSVCTLLALVAAFMACEQGDKKKPPLVTRERSQAVETTAATPAATAEPAPPSSQASAPKPKRKLCDGALAPAGRAVPKAAVSRAAAAGTAEPPLPMPLASGRWTWLNFWAAWCVPCKEEIPRLKSWEARLSGAGQSFQVLFVSMDDDARQLQSFLGSQPAGGLRSTYWLREGQERADWLRGVELDENVALPVHVLIDPKGRPRCTVHGAVEDSDFEQLSALLSQ